jgi:hypothetical protein
MVIKQGQEVRSNAEAFSILGEAMSRVEQGIDADVNYDFKSVEERKNILMFPIGRRKG